MSVLRDARLQKALESAPDAQLRPQARTRRDILAKAHEAVAPAPAWWHRLWHSAGSQRAPWTAAFATVVLATLVTVLWHDREVPGPRSEAPQVERTVASAPAAAAQDAASSAGTPAPKSRPSDAQPKATARKQSPTPAPASPAPAPVPAPAEPPPERRAEQAASGYLRDQAASELAKGSAAQDLAGPARSDAAAPAPAPRAAPARLASQPAAAAATEVRVEGRGRTAQAPLEHPSRLADLLGRVIREARGNEPLEAPVTWRVELRGNGEWLGTLELAGAQARWLPARGGAGTGLIARPDPALLQALDEELGRIAAR